MKDKAEIALQKVYNRYKDTGLQALYLWGSIISPDFDPETSDIDSIGFADDTFPLEYEKEIQSFLASEYPEIKKFGFRILYLSELNGGEVKGNLAKFVPPKLLLHDLPAWLHIAGISFSQTDFSLNVPSREEAIKVQLINIDKELSFIRESPDNRYVVKETARLVDYVQGKRSNVQPFSYRALKEYSSEEDRAVISAIFECKESGWNNEVFEKNLPIFNAYITKIKADLN